MDIQIMEGMDKSRVIIECKEINDEILRLKAHIRLFHARLTAHAEGKTVFVDAVNALYFESVDDRTYLYTADSVFCCDLRLYQITEKLDQVGFVRISKSTVANLHHMYAIRREKNRTLTAEMSNGEKVQVSRTYLQEIQRKLGV